MTLRSLFYFKIDYGEVFVLIPSNLPDDVRLRLWRLPRVPRGIQSEWEEIASAWFRNQEAESGYHVATVVDGLIISEKDPPSRRVFGKIRNHPRIRFTSLDVMSDMESWLQMILDGEPTNVREIKFNVSGGMPSPSEAPNRTSAPVTTVDWKILPAGWWEEALAI